MGAERGPGGVWRLACGVWRRRKPLLFFDARRQTAFRFILDPLGPGFRMTPFPSRPAGEVEAMQTTKQVTVFLENKPGRLANVLAALAGEKVNITALSVMDKHEHSVLRLTSDNPAKTTQIIQKLNTPFTEADVLMVELKNQPGALAHVCEILAAEHINIDYAYCSSGGRNGRVMGIFKVSNAEKAIRVLTQGSNNSARRLERRPLRNQRTYKGTAAKR